MVFIFAVHKKATAYEYANWSDVINMIGSHWNTIFCV